MRLRTVTRNLAARLGVRPSEVVLTEWKLRAPVLFREILLGDAHADTSGIGVEALTYQFDVTKRRGHRWPEQLSMIQKTRRADL